MPSVADLALGHQSRRIALSDRASTQALRLFRRADVRNLDASWSVLAPLLVDTVAEAQVSAATASAGFVRSVAREQGVSQGFDTVIPESFSNMVATGDDLGAALFTGVTTTKSYISKGVAPARAFKIGASVLAAIAKSAVNDMGRESDRVTASSAGYTRYVRVINPGACSRCAILAGVGSYATAFKRHPACKCTAAPIKGDGDDAPASLFNSPGEYFESLPTSEQDRIFTESGAQALRDGADFSAVVNARRGAYAVPVGGGKLPPFGFKNGKPVKAYTGEGTTLRGSFGRAQYRRNQEALKAPGDRYRRTTTRRLTPDGVYALADGDREKALELLGYYGYM
ncbi:VG15 protein [Clavibacter capsici]|uniref:VG15 protein n=1 Tax=Clavibacter capsici TaxID=1874630 RepID=UPI0014283F14|nr:hypothetical protein [Clavibacter capsici]QIS38629.1 hypothetical protein GW572_04440 [Clavibacter capsici]